MYTNISITFTLCNVHRYTLNISCSNSVGHKFEEKSSGIADFSIRKQMIVRWIINQFQEMAKREVDPGLHHTVVWPSAHERPCFSQPRVQLPHLFCGAVS